jgi:hypothetical protein
VSVAMKYRTPSCGGEASRFAFFRPAKPRRFAYVGAHLRDPGMHGSSLLSAICPIPARAFPVQMTLFGVLRRATPVARERAPTGFFADRAGARPISAQSRPSVPVLRKTGLVHFVDKWPPDHVLPKKFRPVARGSPGLADGFHIGKS